MVAERLMPALQCTNTLPPEVRAPSTETQNNKPWVLNCAISDRKRSLNKLWTRQKFAVSLQKTVTWKQHSCSYFLQRKVVPSWWMCLKEGKKSEWARQSERKRKSVQDGLISILAWSPRTQQKAKEISQQCVLHKAQGSAFKHSTNLWVPMKYEQCASNHLRITCAAHANE